MTTAEVVSLAVQVVLGGGLLTGIGLFIKAWAERRKLSADAAEVLSNATVALLSPMNAQVTVLEDRLKRANALIDELEAKLRTANKRVGELEDQVAGMSTDLDRLRRSTPREDS